MCGIAGFIGESKQPYLTFQLISKLFEHSEVRGFDASGYWGVEANKGRVLYHKEPIRSSQFVNTLTWKRLACHNPDLLLVHARGASKGVGVPFINSNNHPFTSSDKKIGLVHNGRITDSEYKSLLEKYEVSSSCDSEIILRIIEGGEHYDPAQLKTVFGEMSHPERLAGIQDVFSLVNTGHMAVAFGERFSEGRVLWMFRNSFRPLWVVDVREILGQVFFVSEPAIWENALSECPGGERISDNYKLIELPNEEVWCLEINNKVRCPQAVRRFRVSREPGSKPWSLADKKIALANKRADFDVLTDLDEADNLAVPSSSLPLLPHIAQKAVEIRGLLSLVESTADYKASISKFSGNELLKQLEKQRKMLEDLLGELEG